MRPDVAAVVVAIAGMMRPAMSLLCTKKQKTKMEMETLFIGEQCVCVNESDKASISRCLLIEYCYQYM